MHRSRLSTFVLDCKVSDLDAAGYERSQYEARVRLGASKLIRGNAEGLPLIWRALKKRPFVTPLRLVALFPTVLIERLKRLRPGRHL